IHCCGVDPSGARRRNDDEDRALKTALALEFLQRQFRACPRRIRTAQPDIDPNGLPGGPSIKPPDLLRAWPGRHECASCATKFFPFHKGCRASCLSGSSWLRPLRFKQSVIFAERGIERTKRGADEEIVGD